MKIYFYLMFAVMPMVNTAVFGHVYLLELMLVPCLLLLFFSSPEKKIIRFTSLDFAVFVFAVFNLVSIVVGGESLYESVRHYRLMVLLPALIYTIFRFSPLNLEQLRKGLFLMIPAVLFETILEIKYYLQHGRRPDLVEGSIDSISLSILICIVISSLVYFRKEIRGIVRKTTGFMAVAGFFVALIINATRASTLSLITFVPVVAFIWENKKIRLLLSLSVNGLLLVYLLLILVSPMLFDLVHVKGHRKMQVTTERLLSPELFMLDLQGRLAMSGNIIRQALEHPILGTGAASYAVGTSVVGMRGYGSAHNFLVSAVIVSGVPGLIILLTLISMCYSQLNSLPTSDQLPGKLGKVIMVNFTTLLLVAITNDLSGGRALLFFFLMALATKVNLLHGESIKEAEYHLLTK